ncbi:MULTISPECIES: helix-turn-helix domain-containing protein [unclassified Fusibacter]|uniref:helix-turn-helix domain-containing protein n=1 Tax=unclassified Fusibacter TaxID=2624464 RepID=UPI0010124EC4|nr:MULTISPECIES: helix-turn-helix transcriptional regulator [unclassified Fusibacter]MCK8061337.1 helix-turn-helix transcriptional regulator [Fusibacter sp. A2]NPE23466.1 helix-turn-helix transcriptional regulator [Fusibacter sp. A1]RXV59072.1 XRE family transcriptional regulator [Fusibacter sp. A1]
MTKHDEILKGLNIGQLIKKRRKELGMTQEEFANAIGMGRSSITFIETRGNETTIELLIKIADALDCDLSYFLKPSQYAWNAPQIIAKPIESVQIIDQLNSKEYVDDLDPLSKDFYYSFIHKLDSNIKDRAKREAITEVMSDLSKYIDYKIQGGTGTTISDGFLEEFERFRYTTEEGRDYVL